VKFSCSDRFSVLENSTFHWIGFRGSLPDNAGLHIKQIMSIVNLSKKAPDSTKVSALFSVDEVISFAIENEYIGNAFGDKCIQWANEYS
jgi:hypothetical protein